MKIVCIYGTRPEAIKLIPVIRQLNEDNEFNVIVCSTEQHKEMLEEVEELFNIHPDYQLKVMRKGQSIIELSIKILLNVNQVLEIEKPDFVFVHGDTATTLNASLAAFYNKIPIGHIEAGLRSYKKYSPFPEEMNRTLISHLASVHFAPTKENKNNLIKENINEENIFVTGNTVIDALFEVISKDKIIDSQFLNKPYILLTTHRRENWGEPMKQIFSAVLDLAKNNDINIVFPMHKNPEIRLLAKDMLGKEKNIHLLDTLNYQDFIHLMNKAFLIMTDSGGIQEEAPSLNVPVVVLRDTTERTEAIKANTVKLAGNTKKEIIESVQLLLKNEKEYRKMVDAKNPYGDGNASKRIINALKSFVTK